LSGSLWYSGNNNEAIWKIEDKGIYDEIETKLGIALKNF